MKLRCLWLISTLLIATTVTACDGDLGFSFADFGLQGEDSAEGQRPEVQKSLNAPDVLRVMESADGPDRRNVYLPTELEGACEPSSLIRDEARVRSLASQRALETLRSYRAALGDAYEDTRSVAYYTAVVDLAALAAGWPLGEGLSNTLLGTFENTIGEQVIKAGFKSVNQRILKDGSLAGVWDQLTSDQQFDGFGSDVSWEYVKQRMIQTLGSAAGETTFLVFDTIKMAASAFEGASSLEALRGMMSMVDDRIFALENQHEDEINGWTQALGVLHQCENQVRLGFQPSEDPGFVRDQAALARYVP